MTAETLGGHSGLTTRKGMLHRAESADIDPRIAKSSIITLSNLVSGYQIPFSRRVRAVLAHDLMSSISINCSCMS